MRNPGGISESRSKNESISEEGSQALQKDSERDDCSSPPCKRLKQGVLSFPVLPLSPTTSDISPETLKLFNTCSSKTEASQLEASVENHKVNGGLVTGAPSPPDTKNATCIPQSAIVSQSLVLNNGIEMACGQGTNGVSSPEANSCVEDELTITYQSLPAKNDDKVNYKSPPLKSAEKQKRKEDREKEKLEKQKLKEEKLKEKQEAKALKEKERVEAKRKRDQERQEKQAEKEKKDKERMEKREKGEKERLERKEKKDEEKRKRDEEKSAKVEEKRKREAERRSIEEEQERKKQKIQANFANFFIKSCSSMPKVAAENGSRFKPFEPKAGMSLSPVTRKELSLDAKNTLDAELQKQQNLELYLTQIERRKPRPKYTKTKLTTIPEITEGTSDFTIDNETVTVDENSNSSIEVIEPSNMNGSPSRAGLKYKLLQFHANYRPAYYGTWRKKSRKISPRNPLKKDMELLDYEVDSDDEWEEEEPGESLSNSEGEDEGDGEDDDEDDDGFFVPHGYLSDDEGVAEDEDLEDGNSKEGDDGKVKSGQHKREQQLEKAKAWEAEMKRKCKPMKPVTVGCLWSKEASFNLTLKKFSACLLVDDPIHVESSNSNTGNNPSTMDSSNNSGALYVPDEAMPLLLKIIHGNTVGIHKIMSLFRKQWTSKCLCRDVTDEEVNENCSISKRQIEKKIQDIATKERRTDRLRWYVHKHVLEKFGLENLTMVDGLNCSDSSVHTTMFPVSPASTNSQSIKQFVRPVSPALQGTASLKLKHNSQEPPNLPSPMEVDSTRLSQNPCRPTMESSSIFGGELPVGNKMLINISQACNPTFVRDKKTFTNTTSQDLPSQNIQSKSVD